MEPLRNMGLICPNCAPKPNPKFKDTPLAELVGQYCKLSFPAPNDRHEYMWVFVTGLAESEGEELRGKIDNDPVIALDFQCGDLIEFSRSEIIDVTEG